MRDYNRKQGRTKISLWAASDSSSELSQARSNNLFNNTQHMQSSLSYTSSSSSGEGEPTLSLPSAKNFHGRPRAFSQNNHFKKQHRLGAGDHVQHDTRTASVSPNKLRTTCHNQARYEKSKYEKAKSYNKQNSSGCWSAGSAEHSNNNCYVKLAKLHISSDKSHIENKPTVQNGSSRTRNALSFSKMIHEECGGVRNNNDNFAGCAASPAATALPAPPKEWLVDQPSRDTRSSKNHVAKKSQERLVTDATSHKSYNKHSTSMNTAKIQLLRRDNFSAKLKSNSAQEPSTRVENKQHATAASKRHKPQVVAPMRPNLPQNPSVQQFFAAFMIKSQA